MIKSCATAISSDKSAAYLLLGKLLRANGRVLNVTKAITKIKCLTLKLLSEEEQLIKIDSYFGLSSIKGVVSGTQINSEGAQNVFI